MGIWEHKQKIYDNIIKTENIIKHSTLICFERQTSRRVIVSCPLQNVPNHLLTNSIYYQTFSWQKQKQIQTYSNINSLIHPCTLMIWSCHELESRLGFASYLSLTPVLAFFHCSWGCKSRLGFISILRVGFTSRQIKKGKRRHHAKKYVNKWVYCCSPSPIASDPFMIRSRLQESTNILHENKFGLLRILVF